MMNWISICSSFRVTNSFHEPEFPDHVKRKVDEIWQSETRLDPKLFDGQALCVSSASNTSLKCFPIPYRFLFAQQKDSIIKESLRLKSAAVSGVLINEGHVFVGQRSNAVTQSRRLFELVPSGSLPAVSEYSEQEAEQEIDYRGHLLVELEEEVGVPPGEVASITPFLLVEDDVERVVDICCKIKLKTEDAKRILDLFVPSEYSKLKAWNLSEISKIPVDLEGEWVPTSAILIRHLQGSRLVRPETKLPGF